MDLNSLGMSLDEMEFNDAELEAELKALSGPSAAAKPKPRPRPRQVSSELTEAELADALREKNYDDIDDMDLSGDEDLENELAALMGSDPVTPQPAPAPVPPKRAAPPPVRPPLAKQPVSVGGIASPTQDPPSRQSQPVGPPPPLPTRTASVVAPNPPESASVPKAVVEAPKPVKEDVSNLSEADEVRHILKHRLDAYRKNVALATEAGDSQHVAEYKAIVEMFEQACVMADEGEVTKADLADVPTTPKLYRKAPVRIVPKTLLEDLQQRQKVLLELAGNSHQSGEEARARRYERMANQFKDAVASCQKGRPVDIAALPPVAGLPALEEMPYAKNQKPVAPRQPGAAAAAVTAIAAGGVPGPSATKLTQHQKSTAIEGDTSQKNELRFLLDRQEQFKIAAITAKKAGDMKTATEMLLNAKKLEPMIRSSEGGLPVDIREVPVPPQSGVSAKLMRQVSVGADARLQDVEKALLNQLTFCEEQGAAFRQLNDAKSSLLFDKLMKETKLDLLHFRQQLNSGTASASKINSVLMTLPTTNQPIVNGVADDHLEIKIVGIEKLKLADGYKLHHLAIYVKATFGYPRENPQTAKTTTISGTDCPEFGELVIFNIDRKSKPLVRAIKSKPIKLEVFQKGSFLRSDKHWGTAEVSLASLEKQPLITTSSEIIGERRAKTGGRVTVQVRVARPITESDTGLANRRKAPTVQKQWVRIQR